MTKAKAINRKKLVAFVLPIIRKGKLPMSEELEKLRQSRPFIPGELISMELVVGLPPLYYRSQYKKFRDYFYREGRLVHFAYMGRSYRLALTLW